MQLNAIGMNDKWKGHLAVLAANIIFGLNVPITKALLDRWMTPLGYMATRTLAALAIFWSLQCFLPKERVTRRDLLIIAVGGIMGFVISQFLTALSLQYTSPVYFSLIVALSPVCVMLLAALFLREPVTRKKMAGVALGVLGASLLIVRAWGDAAGGSDNLKGIVLACVSILAYSVYLIVMRSVSQRYSAVTQMKWMFLFTAIILVPLGVNEYPHQSIYTSAWEWSGVFELAFVVLFATSAGYFLMPFGMKYLRATTVSIYMNLQPVVASVTAIFVGQDVFSWDKPLAALLVLAGAYIVSAGTREDRPNPAIESPVKISLKSK